MSAYVTQARPYANALFEVALAQHQLSEWSEVLASLAAIFSHAEIVRWLKNPGRLDEELVGFSEDLLVSLHPAASKALGDTLSNFLTVLATNKRLYLLPAIQQGFHQLYSEHADLRDVEVISAFALSDEQKSSLQKKLAHRFQTTIRMSYQEDKTLIGGLIIQAGNWVMDSSVKGKLVRLNEELLS